jgi:hypothetical protein
MTRLIALAAAILVAAACTPSPIPRTSAVPDQQLIAAAWNNDVPAASRLIAAGADVNAVDDTEQSAFLIAASEGYLDLLELTLQHGADVRSLDSYRGRRSSAQPTAATPQWSAACFAPA